MRDYPGGEVKRIFVNCELNHWLSLSLSLNKREFSNQSLLSSNKEINMLNRRLQDF